MPDAKSTLGSRREINLPSSSSCVTSSYARAHALFSQSLADFAFPSHSVLYSMKGENRPHQYIIGCMTDYCYTRYTTTLSERVTPTHFFARDARKLVLSPWRERAHVRRAYQSNAPIACVCVWRNVDVERERAMLFLCAVGPFPLAHCVLAPIVFRRR